MSNEIGTKKLMLKKETIANLRNIDMSYVRGGGGSVSDDPPTEDTETCWCAPTWWEGCQ